MVQSNGKKFWKLEKNWINTVWPHIYSLVHFAHYFVYSDESIIKQTYLARLEQPRPYDIEFLRSWFRRPGMGSFPLLGIDGNSWDVEYEDDLVAIKARTAPDMFSKWFTETLVPIYHHLLGERFKVFHSLSDYLHQHDNFNYRSRLMMKPAKVYTIITSLF